MIMSMSTCILSYLVLVLHAMCVYFQPTYPQHHAQTTKISPSVERKYQEACDYIDKGSKQEIRAQEIYISFPENRIRGHRKQCTRLIVCSPISHGNYGKCVLEKVSVLREALIRYQCEFCQSIFCSTVIKWGSHHP